MPKSGPGGSKRWQKQRREIADFIWIENGATITEISTKFGITPQTAARALNELIKYGDICKGVDKEPNGKIDHRKVLYLPT